MPMNNGYLHMSANISVQDLGLQKVIRFSEDPKCHVPNKAGM